MIILSPFRKGAIYAGSTCRGHNNPTLLVLRRASNHSPNLSPIVGKRLKKIIAETDDYFYVLVSRDDGLYCFIGARATREKCDGVGDLFVYLPKKSNTVRYDRKTKDN